MHSVDVLHIADQSEFATLDEAAFGGGGGVGISDGLHTLLDGLAMATDELRPSRGALEGGAMFVGRSLEVAIDV